MDAIHARKSADSVCETAPAKLPTLRITILHNYNNDGMLVWCEAKDTLLSGLGDEIHLSPIPDCLALVSVSPG